MLLNDSENAEESSLLSVEWSQIQWKPYDFDELQNVLIRYMSVDYNIEQLYGHPNTWDITSIESLAGLFNVEPLKDFNADISNWDTSEVTDMSSMFENCTSFNQDISKWNIKKVTNMSKMFKNATVFNFKREDTDYSVGFKNWLMQNREGKFIDDPNGVYIAVEREFDENDFADLDSITFEIGYYLEDCNESGQQVVESSYALPNESTLTIDFTNNTLTHSQDSSDIKPNVQLKQVELYNDKYTMINIIDTDNYYFLENSLNGWRLVSATLAALMDKGDAILAFVIT